LTAIIEMYCSTVVFEKVLNIDDESVSHELVGEVLKKASVVKMNKQ
jgi:hypothetical protein